MRTLFTVGHSNIPKEHLLERLQIHNIQRLVDVRTKPYSRFCPQYNRTQLAHYLATNEITYDFRGDNLGGLGENVNFDQTLAELYELAQTQNIVLMCSEKAPEKCHRYLVLTPALEALGAVVTDIARP